jgi:PAS domain S-box-containing protein
LDPLVTISPEGKITDVNEATEQVTGVPRSELIGSDFSNYFTEPDKAREGYQQVISDGYVRDYPLTIHHTSGRTTDVLYNATVYRNGAGEVQGVFAAARDVTVQKQASQYARSLIESSLDPLVTISADGKITDVNEATIKVTGVPREQLIGTDFSNYFTEPQKAREGYQQVFAQGFVTDYPLTIRHKDGQLTDVLYNASVYKDTHGDVLGVFAAARDVTVQKQASQYARSLIESSLDPLVTISADGKITDVNEATIKVTGVLREQLIGTDFSNYFTEPQRAREGYQQVFAKGFVTDYPLTIHHKDGQLTDVLYNASVYTDTHGDVLGVFAAARDITERKRAETELARYREHLEELVLHRTDDLARSNRDLEQFAYVASHDLQEPLRAVGGFVGLLQQRYQGKLDEKADSYIGSAVDGVTRMQTLIGDLLSYSRVGTKGKAMEPTDPGEAVKNALTNLQASIEESGAIIQVDPLPTVRADAVQLTQLYQNLIANAIKFQSDKPPAIHVGARREQDAWLFWVRDNGIGIEPQYAERIFMIFQRLHTRKAYPGTGIGLAICKRIVERHGGSIWVESQPGQGSTFYFTLPDKGEHL